MSAQVLVVDDEGNIRRMVRALLETEGYVVSDAATGEAAVATVRANDPDVVLLDLVMPGDLDGLATLARLREESADRVVVMMSGRATLTDAVRAIRLGAMQFLEKPLTPERVLGAVNAAAAVAATRAENRSLRDALGTGAGLIGPSPELTAVRDAIAQVAPTPSRVLITGESGTGKELVARAIHTHSPRHTRPLVTVNCAAIPRELLESEMFGHERGAFTGAGRQRRGRFATADRGTLFLDEVGDLPLEAQAKLLRVLETGEIHPVGADQPVAVDVRLLAATHRDLREAVAAGRFREDLYYRLDVFPIHIPPLRERPDDIPELVTHLAAVTAARCGRPPVRFTPDAVARLAGHPWPGNVRELANLVERLSIFAPRHTVEVDQVATALAAAPRAHRARLDRLPANLQRALTVVERDLITRALHASEGNVARAARTLETDRPNLYRRMRRLGLSPRDDTVS